MVAQQSIARPAAAVVLCVTCAIAPIARCQGADTPGGFKISLRVDLGSDVGQNAGTLFEALDDDGKPVAGAGFLGAYNTQDRSDRRLVHFYVRLDADDDAFRPEPLPRPSSDAGTYLYGFDNRLYSFGRSGADRKLRQWDANGGQWRIDTSSVPLSIHVGQSVLRARQREVQHAGRTVLTLPSDQGLISEPYYAGGFFVFRRRNPDATPAGNELLACAWTPDRTEPISPAAGIPLTLHTPREFVYAYGQLGKKILAATNTGGAYAFDASSGRWQTLRTPNGVSFQIYAAINYEDRLLLGQYPTGELFEFDGKQLRHLPDWPPVMKGASTRAREAQTLTIYGGDLYAGVWPWGEVWRLDRRENNWRFLGRMFSHPEPTDETTHPYENESTKLDQVLNRWGQRVTSLTPHGNSLYIATSSKGGTPYEAKFGFLSDAEAKQYGSVYRYHKPGSLAAQFEWRTGATTFEFVHDGSRLAVFQDGARLGEAECKLPAVGEISRVAWGSGVFGQLTGKIESHDVTKLVAATRTGDRIAASAEPFLAAYVNMGRCFDPQDDIAARGRAIDEHLDRAVHFGLNAIIPYANTSSWSVNYPSELVTRKTFGDWDPLARFVSGARQRGLSVWPAVCVCSSGHFEPRGVLVDHPEWAIRDPQGKPLGFISPAHPEARKWLISVLREIVRNYQPDGVLLDYLRYFNRPWQLDERAQSALDVRLAAESAAGNNNPGRVEQRFKEEHLTQLAREISGALRAEKPDLKIAIYSWGPHVAHDHLVAQDWKTWVAEGYVDMVNVSGYCYPGQYGEKYLEVFESRLRQSAELAAQTGKSIPISFALGVETSHGKVTSAGDIERYLKAARRACVSGTALFTWSTAQPYLEELANSGALHRFVGKAER